MVDREREKEQKAAYFLAALPFGADFAAAAAAAAFISSDLMVLMEELDCSLPANCDWKAEMGICPIC